MKTIKHFLAVMVMASILYSCGCDKQKSTSAVSTESEGFVVTRSTPDRASDADIQHYIRTTVPQKKTFRINEGSAFLKLSFYKIWAQRISSQNGNGRIDWENAMYGYLVNFDSLYSYMTYIKGIKDSLDITGLRVYQGAEHLSSGFMPDVFFYPTTSDGRNIDPIDLDYQKIEDQFFNGEKMVDDQKFYELIEELKQTYGEDFLGDAGGGYNSTLPCPQSCP